MQRVGHYVGTRVMGMDVQGSVIEDVRDDI